MTETNELNKMTRIEQALDALLALKIEDVPLLMEKLAEKGIKPAAATMAVAPAAAGEATAEQPAEKRVVNIILKEVPATAKKLDIIRKVKEMIANMGLKEARDFIEPGNLPATIKENVPKEEAEEKKALFESLGAKIELE